jgi:hypothetical protein
MKFSVRYWRKKGSTMRQYISYSETSRKPKIQRGRKYRAFNHPGNLPAAQNA